MLHVDAALAPVASVDHPAPAVRASGLRRRFDDVVALDGVDLQVLPGEVHGLVGPNGAGKTTLLGLLLGLATPDEGTLEVLGERPGRGRAVPGVAGFLDGPGLYPSLTARANLAALQRLRGAERAAIRADVDAALERVGLREVADDRVRGFSLGMRQRLGLAAAVLARPRVLVLDEPANGLDPAGTRVVREVIAGLAAEGVAVVLSTHRMDDLAVLCDAVTVLHAGRVVHAGPPSSLVPADGVLEHRLLTTDPERARRIAAAEPGLDDLETLRDGALVVRTDQPGLDALLRSLLDAGVGVREVGPLVPPLEAAFLALTEAAS